MASAAASGRNGLAGVSAVGAAGASAAAATSRGSAAVRWARVAAARCCWARERRSAARRGTSATAIAVPAASSTPVGKVSGAVGAAGAIGVGVGAWTGTVSAALATSMDGAGGGATSGAWRVMNIASAATEAASAAPGSSRLRRLPGAARAGAPAAATAAAPRPANPGGAAAPACPRRASPASCQRDQAAASAASCSSRRCRKRASSSPSSPSNSAESCWRVWSRTLSSGCVEVMPLLLRIVHQLPQLLVDRIARAEDPRTHRADRAIHPLRDLLVTHAFDLAQGDRLAQLVRQALDSAHDRLFHLLAHQFALGGVVVAQADAGIELLGVRDVDVRARRPAPGGDQVVLGRVDRDPVQPGVELGVAAEVAERAVGAQEGFLGHVLAFAPVADVAADERDDPVLVLAHQQVERGAVAALHALHQRLVRVAWILFCHALPALLHVGPAATGRWDNANAGKVPQAGLIGAALTAIKCDRDDTRLPYRNGWRHGDDCRLR